MHFPSKLDENIDLLAKNNRFSDVEKGALLLHSMAVHDELTDEERSYGESVAAGWMRQRAEEQSDSPQWQQYYGKIRAAQMNGNPTAFAESTVGVDEGNSRFVLKSSLLKAVNIQSGFKCRDCNYIAKTSDDSECFEHTKRTGHNTGFDLLK